MDGCVTMLAWGIMMDLRPSRNDVISLLSDLVAIDSVNPSLVPGAAGEAEIARYVASWLRTSGLEVETPEAAPGRPNVVARTGGARAGRRLLLNAHLDTVGVSGMRQPFEPRIEGDRLYGRGAFDMKGGLAAIMLAARAVFRSDVPSGTLILAAVADEEYASAGTEQVVTAERADAAIVTEPTGLSLCAAHKGFAWIAIETKGRAAHGSRPDLGVDAIAHMGRVLVDLEDLGRDLARRPGHALLGHGSIHASLIEGGQELSSYPEGCRLHVERRTLPGESPEAVEAEMARILTRRANEDPSFAGRARLSFWREPFEVAPDHEIVRLVYGAATSVLDQAPTIYGDTAWMDAAILAHAGIPTVVFGPGGAGAHSNEEWGSIEQVALCAEILARTALDFFRPREGGVTR